MRPKLTLAPPSPENGEASGVLTRVLPSDLSRAADAFPRSQFCPMRVGARVLHCVFGTPVLLRYCLAEGLLRSGNGHRAGLVVDEKCSRFFQSDRVARTKACQRSKSKRNCPLGGSRSSRRSMTMTARRISVRRRVNPLIREPLAVELLKHSNGALIVAIPKRLAMVVSEVELVNVALQMLLAHALVDARQAALKDGEESLHGIGRDGAAHIFVAIVVDGFMRREVAIQFRVHAKLVRMYLAQIADMGAKCWT